MTQATFFANSSPAATSTTAVVAYPASITAGDLLLLLVSSDSPSIGTAPTGFTQLGSVVTGSTNTAAYSKTATGTETGSVTVNITSGTKGLATMAAYRPPSGFGASAAWSAGGVDSDTTSTAYSAATASITSHTDDVVVAFTTAAAASGTFAGSMSGFSLAQSGATMGTGATRVSGRTGTNTMAYNLYDRPITVGGTGAVTYAATANGANASGTTIFVGVRCGTAATPPTSSATVPTTATGGATYAVTDTSTATTTGAAIASRVWRIVSGGGSLSSTTASTVTVTAPASGTQVIGIIATDSNGMAGTEATYSVSVSAVPVANAGPDQTVDSVSTTTLAGSGTPTPTAWLWRQVSGPTVTLSSTTVAAPTFKAPASVAGTAVVLGLKVYNGAAVSAEDTVLVTVRPHIEWVLSGGVWIPTLTLIL